MWFTRAHAHMQYMYAMEEHNTLLGLICDDTVVAVLTVTITIRFYIKCKKIV